MPVATRLFVQTQPIGQNFSGRPLLTQPQIYATDVSITTDTGYVGTVVPTLTVLTGAATLGGSEAAGKACVAGVCQFTNLTVTATASATWTLHFTSGALTAIDSSPTQKSYLATKLVVTTAPAATIPAGVGARYPYAQMIVQAQTAGSVLDTTVGVAPGSQSNTSNNDPYATVTLNMVTGGPAVISGADSAGFAGGEACFRGIALSAAGTYTYTVSYNGVSVTSGVFTVTSAVDTFVNPDSRMRGLGAALPRSVPSSTPPTQAGATLNVGSGQTYTTIQSAYDAASYGDTIVLKDGNTFSESVVFSAKAWGAGWIVIRSETTPTVAGQRTKPADYTTQAIWQPPAANNAYTFKAITGASHIWIQGVQFRTNPAIGLNSGLCLMGFDDGDSLASGVPDTLVLDRCYLHHDDPTAARTCNRAVRWRSSNSSIINNYFTGFQAVGSGQDAQSILADNTPGPLLLDNNYFSGGESEDFMIGGAGNLGAQYQVHDVTITRNVFTKPIAQKGAWQVKNLLELKEGHRVLIEGNIFDIYWDSGVSQPSTINLKSVNQNAAHGEAYVGTSDVTVRHNFFRNIPGFVTIAGAPTGECEPESRVVIYNNLLSNVNSATYNGNGSLFASIAASFDVVFDHLTYVGAPRASGGVGLAMGTVSSAATRTTLTNLLIVTDFAPTTIVGGTGASSNVNSVTALLDPAMVVDKLYFAGIDPGWVNYNTSNSPAGNTFIAADGSNNAVDPGFTSYAIRSTDATADPLTVCDAFVLASGAAKGGGTGGSDIGVADMATLKTKITGVVLGVYGVAPAPLTQADFGIPVGVQHPYRLRAQRFHRWY